MSAATTTGGGALSNNPFSIATWNVNSLRVRSGQLMEWLRANSPDVIALQETKIQDPDFPHETFTAVGYHSVFSGQKTYNGVALLSRHVMTDVVRDMPGFIDAPRRVLAATIGGFRVINLYVPNGQAPGSEKFTYKLGWLEALTRWLEVETKPGSTHRWWWLGTSTSRPRIVTSMIRPHGQAACMCLRKNALHSNASPISNSSMRSAISSSRSARSAGGITARARFAATPVCASISFWCIGACCRGSAKFASTRIRDESNGPLITLPSLPPFRRDEGAALQ
jgi:hypothetical protein